MLTIRMQRTGRKGLANFRVIVQDSRFSPNSGRVVAQLGHYNPHTKETVLDKEKAEKYLANGAQPSDRVIKLLQDQKVKLPKWVEMPANDKKRNIRNPEKLRKNQPDEPEVTAEDTPVAEAPTPVEEAKTEESAVEEVKEDASVEEKSKEPVAEEEPAKEKAEDKADEKPAETDEEKSE